MKDSPADQTSFRERFATLTGHPPFGWQARLYERLRAGDIPSECDIPTGLGKTSVLALWLLTLAEQATHSETPLTLPRRLVYIVDRRAVVDQATTEAEDLLKELRRPPPDSPLAPLAAALCELAVAPDPETPFALSTLRGQYADNRQWSHDPARPAIIVGTVDMIGSRLLFAGYGGLGRYGRSQHAALLGQDALIVLDEAQLAPAFLQTLLAIQQTVRVTSGELKRPFAFMSLTATQPRPVASPDAAEREEARAQSDSVRAPLTLEPGDFLREEIVCRRVRAAKHLRFVLPQSGGTGRADDALAQQMAQEAVDLAGANGAVVVFVDTVALLDKIYTALSKFLGPDAEKYCLRFTGQMRGQERDDAFADRAKESAGGIFSEFQLSRPRAGKVHRSHPVFLLATSAGEVGVNFDADHAVCDLVSLERMAQRLGRVNRGGDHDGPAHITVFIPFNPDKLEPVPAATYRLLQDLPMVSDSGDQTSSDTYLASPEELGKILKNSDARRAFTPASGPPPLDPARLDDWSLTSLRQDEFLRPQVSYWLRGITPDDEQAVTRIVWREELRYARFGPDAADMLETCPPLPREILQVPTRRAADWLLARARKHLGVRRLEADPNHGELAAIRTTAGKWESRTLEYFQNLDKDKLKADLANTTLVLPTTFGGLTRTGFLDDSVDEKTHDVLGIPGTAVLADEKTCRRVLFYGSPTLGWTAYDLLVGPSAEPFAEEDSYAMIIRKSTEHFQLAAKPQRYRLKSRQGEPEKTVDSGDGVADSPVFRVEYFVPVRTYKERGEALLEAHLAEAQTCAESIVRRLDLPTGIRDAVVCAAVWHDLGKHREKWQRAIGNTRPDVFLAKSNRSFYDHSEAEGYRHEFGSLMDAIHLKKDELASQPESELILHLIAAHHGHGRPGFQEKAYDVPEHLFADCAQVACEAELRFDQLQRRFGWWGLAYLEALVKCADGIASDRAANPPETLASDSGVALSKEEKISSRP